MTVILCRFPVILCTRWVTKSLHRKEHFQWFQWCILHILVQTMQPQIQITNNKLNWEPEVNPQLTCDCDSLPFPCDPLYTGYKIPAQEGTLSVVSMVYPSYSCADNAATNTPLVSITAPMYWIRWTGNVLHTPPLQVQYSLPRLLLY